MSTWYEIDGFASPGEYDRFCAYLRRQVDAGAARQVPADPDYSRHQVCGGAWYKDLETGETWRLVPPDFPFRGLWERVELAEDACVDATVRRVIQLPRRFTSRVDTSMFSLLRETSYFVVHEQVTEGLIRDALREHPECVAEWLSFSEAKRTSSGWFLRRGERGYEVGYYPASSDDHQVVEYPDAVAACAAFIKREIEDMRTD